MNNRFAIVALMTAAVAAVASADTVEMRFTGSAKGRVVRISHPAGAANVFAGQLNHSLINPVGPDATAIASGWACHNLVLPSTSVSRNDAIPVGRSTIIHVHPSHQPGVYPVLSNTDRNSPRVTSTWRFTGNALYTYYPFVTGRMFSIPFSYVHIRF